MYSTFIICFVHIFKTLGQRSWRIFAVVSVPGDLTIMGICLAKITILSFSGLPADCHGLTRENCKMYPTSSRPYLNPLVLTWLATKPDPADGMMSSDLESCRRR